ncbi:hypothetical protein LCGC14_2878930, partial [marine sediment metagenome]
GKGRRAVHFFVHAASSVGNHMPYRQADEATCSIVLEAEKAGANRASLVKWLEERV